MTRSLPFLVLCLLLAACFNDDSEEVTALEGTVSVQDSVIAAQRTELDGLRAAFDTARTVAADSALAHLGDGDGRVARDERTSAYADPGVPVNAPPPRGPVSGRDDGAGAPAGPRPAQDALAYDTYRNERFGFAIDYPHNLLQPDEGLGDGHGQSFASPDGEATLIVYGTDEGGALREEYEAELGRDDLRVTYHVVRPDWFVVSGYQGPYIFYQRTHRQGDGLRTFRLRHRAADKDYFDPVVERLSHSFAG